MYTGPGPAVIGEREYQRLMTEDQRTAGGRIGSAVLDPIFEPAHADPVEEVAAEEAFATLHVMKALKKIADTDDLALVAGFLAEEQARGGSGPRPTVLAALQAKLA